MNYTPGQNGRLRDLEARAAELEQRLRGIALGAQPATVQGHKLVGVYWAYGGDNRQVPIKLTATAWRADQLRHAPAPMYGLLWVGSHNQVLRWRCVRPSIVDLISSHDDRLGVSALLTDDAIGCLPFGAFVVKFDDSPLAPGQLVRVLHGWLSELPVSS